MPTVNIPNNKNMSNMAASKQYYIAQSKDGHILINKNKEKRKRLSFTKRHIINQFNKQN